MSEQIFTNKGDDRRIWPSIIRPDTERTLELDPNESVSLDLPSDFKDRFLQPQAKPKAKAPVSTETGATEHVITTDAPNAVTKETV